MYLYLFSRFYLYKLPKQHGSSSQNGEKYLLMDNGSEGWTEGKVIVNDTTGALGRTLGPLYSQGKVCVCVWLICLLKQFKLVLGEIMLFHIKQTGNSFLLFKSKVTSI